MNAPFVNKHMNIKTLTIEQLKALAYDQIAARDNAQSNINVINNEITLRLNVQETKTEEVSGQEASPSNEPVPSPKARKR